MRIDPEATLRLWSVDVDIADRTYLIPPLPAQAWIVAVHGSWADIVPGMLVNADDLEDLIADGTVGHDECVRAARAAVEAASGARWWTAVKLAHCAGGEIGAELLLRGVDPERVPWGAWLLAAHRVATRDAKDVEVARVDAELDAPPQGLALEELADEAGLNAQFAAAMASTGR